MDRGIARPWLGGAGLIPVLVGILLLLAGAMPLPAAWRSEPVRLLAFAVLSTLSATLTLRRVFTGPLPPRLLRDFSTGAALAFAGWVVLSAILSRLPALSAYEAMRHLAGVMLYVSVAYGFSRSDVRWVGRLGTLALAAVAGGGLLVYGSSNGQLLGGAFVDEQLLAGALVVLLPFTLAVAYRDGQPRWRMIGVAVVCVAFVTLLLTRNRTAWVAIAVGLAVQVALELQTRPPAGEMRRVPVRLLLILVGVLGIFALSTGRAPAVVDRLATLGQTERDATLHWRHVIWGTAWQLVSERPALGWGVGTFAVRQARYRYDGRTPRDILLEGATLSESAHNTYLQTAAEMGIPGLALYLAIPMLLAYTLVRRLRRSRPGHTASLAAAAAGALAVQAICGYASPAWDFAQCSVFQWFALGGAALLSRTGSRGDDAQETAV